MYVSQHCSVRASNARDKIRTSVLADEKRSSVGLQNIKKNRAISGKIVCFERSQHRILPTFVVKLSEVMGTRDREKKAADSNIYLRKLEKLCLCSK